MLRLVFSANRSLISYAKRIAASVNVRVVTITFGNPCVVFSKGCAGYQLAENNPNERIWVWPRIILNETSYFGPGSRSVLADEINRRSFKKALFVTDQELLKFGVAQKVTTVLEGDRGEATITAQRRAGVGLEFPVAASCPLSRECSAKIYAPAST